MANIRKQFNFRNGLQVDDDNLVVSPTGLVGIGTTIPTEALDVRGTAKVVGLVTANQIFTPTLEAGNVSITNLSLSNSIIGAGVSILSGIITASGSGVVTYYGDGGRLTNLPTSQWLDVDVGLGFTSIYAQGFVGVSTNDPRYPFQIGGNNDLGSFTDGVGIGSTGNILATGRITAGHFSGIGSNITLINADNISLGTINNDRIPVLLNSKLPSNINVSGIITATGGFIGTVAGNVFGNVTGNVVGNLTGIATFARNLFGTPDITVGTVDATSINLFNTVNTVSLQATGIVTSQGLSIGSGGTSFFTSDGKLGIGSGAPTKEIQVIKSDTAEIELIGTNYAQLIIGQNPSTQSGIGTSTAILRFGNYNRTFDIINRDSGNFNHYLHTSLPVSGVTTGNFNWIYGQTNIELMTLTYGGRLGIGKTNPDNTLHVVGTSTVTGESWFGNNVNISGNLSFGGNLTGNVVASEAQQVYATSGVSTFYGVTVADNLSIFGSIGLGTTAPTVGVDARNDTGLFSNIGIGTTSFTGSLRVNGPSVLSSLSIGDTTTDDGSGFGIYSILSTVSDSIISGINSTSILLDTTCSIGIGTTEQRSVIDFSAAGLNYYGGDGAYMLVPTLTSTQRAGLSTYAGGIIYNSTVNEFQGSVGVNTTWINLGITTSIINSDQLRVTGITTLGIASATNLSSQQLNVSGIATASQIKVGTGVTINSGIVTAVNGFTSGIGTAVVITTVGNRIFFTVAGVGSTSLQLF